MKKRKILLPVLLICLLLISLLGSAAAYMFRQTDPVTNEFVPARVSCTVTESFDGTDKSSIAVTNTGNIDAYLRVRLVSYWVNGAGEIVAKASVMPTFSVASGWIKGSSDTYYYSSPVAPGASTPNLLSSSITLSTSSEGYQQVVDVFAEAIQSNPVTAAESSWGVAITDGKISSP